MIESRSVMEAVRSNGIDSPRVSVVMPVYNGEQYLAAAIESVLNQSFCNFEFIIIDDASTDRTAAILAEYAHQDQRIKLFKNHSRLGIIPNLNKGLSLAKGEYLARQDADDISLPDRFKKQVERLNANPKTVLVSCDLEIIDAEGRHLYDLRRSCDPVLVAWYLLFQNRLAGHSQVMFRKDIALEIGGYAKAKLHIEDYDLWGRLANIGVIEILPDTLLRYRSHNNSISSAHSLEQINSSLIQSQSNIEQLTHNRIAQESIKALKAFWALPDKNIYFPVLEKTTPQDLQQKLAQIYLAFLNKPDSLWERTLVAQKVRRLTSQHFLFWANCLRWRDHPASKFACLRFAFWWDSNSCLRFVLSSILLLNRGSN